MDIDKYLSKFQKFTDNPTLNAMEFFMKEFNYPNKKIKIIHVAGTNGKGSTCEMIYNILYNNGYKVGKYVSPPLISFNERIIVNNKEISNNEIEELINLINPKIEKYNNENKTKVTLFEVVTTMAILYFEKQKCDFIILEVGLGGTLDCTNVVEPLISIITSIGYDHMDILGDTIDKIANQKAGIIKKDSITVCLKQKDIQKVIEDKCKTENNKLYWVDPLEIKNYTYTEEFQKFDFESWNNIIINLKGKKQIYNTSLCLKCIEILRLKGYEINQNIIVNSLKNIVHKARFEKINQRPIIIYDGAHNEPAIENFIESTNMYYTDNKKIFIISLLKTKDYKSIIKKLMKIENSIFYFTDGNDIQRYNKKENLIEEAKKYNKSNELHIELFDKAVSKCIRTYKNEVIYILGSFYTYADTIETVKKLS